MAARPVLTLSEWAERVRHAEPPRSDDVPITRDGRRLDTPEKVRAWLDELAEQRAAEDLDRLADALRELKPDSGSTA